MDFIDLAKQRYSSRKYSDKAVEKEKLDRILEAGRLAPTAKNLQPVRVIVDTDPEHTKLETANLYGAPVGLAVVADKDVAFTRPFDGKNFADIDASIVMTQMMYEATDLGLGTVWIGWFDPAVIHDKLGLKDSEEVSGILAVGYRDDETSRNHGVRKPEEEFVYRTESD